MKVQKGEMGEKRASEWREELTSKRGVICGNGRSVDPAGDSLDGSP